MHLRIDGRWRYARLCLGAAAIGGQLVLTAHAAPANARVLRDQVNRLADRGFESPQEALARLRALKARQDQADTTARRLVETGIGLVAADNNLGEDVRVAVAELESLVASAGPIAHADALLVLGDYELSAAQTSKSAARMPAAVVAYAPFCEAGPRFDGGACNPFNWFWANMFAGEALASTEAHTSAGIYLQAAAGIAARAHRPDLEARAVAISAELAQDEHDIGLSDRLLRRADALALRSEDDSAREFVAMFTGDVLQQRGDLADALVKLQEALQIAQHAGHARRVMDLSDGLIQVELKQGHPDRALARIADALPQAQAWHEQAMVDLLHVNQLVALLRLGRLAQARQLIGPLLDSLDDRVSAVDRGETIDTLGNAFVATGAMDDAMALFKREQPSLRAAGDKPFQRTMLAWQTDLAAAQQLQRHAEVRRWTLLGALTVALLLAAGAAIPWLRLRNRRLARANDALRSRSERDPLTGLLNRDGLMRGLRGRGLAEAFEGTLLLLDVDHFKSINDTLGHAGGDAVLREVAVRLQSCLRDGDFVVRWGGEELVVAVLARPFDADALVDRILQALASSPIAFQQRAVAVSASIGYVSVPLAGDAEPMSFHEALAVADAGMYYAKRNGRRTAVRIARLPRALLADLGGLPAAVEREALTGAVELQVRRLAAADGAVAAPCRSLDATAPLAS